MTASSQTRSTSVGRAAAVLVVALVVALTLAAQPLRAAAENLESKAVRGVALTVTWPFGKIGEGLHVEAARQWALHAFEDEPAGTSTIVSTPMSTDGLVPPTTSVPADVSEPGQAGGTTSTTDGRPRVDHRDPLHVLVVGDSLVQEVAKGLIRVSEGLPLEIDYRYKISSGLVNTGFFDWPAELDRLIAKYEPDVTVLMYGNNDHQGLTVDGSLVPPLEPAWLDEYGRRVKVMAGTAERAGSRVVWVGMPIMRSAKYSTTARTLNEVFSGVCESEGYWYMDAYRLFSDKSGSYAPYLPDATGKPRLMRGADGIHLTAAGGNEAGLEILRILSMHYLIES